MKPRCRLHPYSYVEMEQTRQCDQSQTTTNRSLSSTSLSYLVPSAATLSALQILTLQVKIKPNPRLIYYLWRKITKKNPKELLLPARFVMALDSAKAEDTPLPPPDISSPRSNFVNLSFIISVSTICKPTKL